MNVTDKLLIRASEFVRLKEIEKKYLELKHKHNTLNEQNSPSKNIDTLEGTGIFDNVVSNPNSVKNVNTEVNVPADILSNVQLPQPEAYGKHVEPPLQESQNAIDNLNENVATLSSENIPWYFLGTP
jgi:hypothetical protein